MQVTVVLLLDKGRSVPPTHADATGLNQIASPSVSAFFGLVVVWELLMIKGWRN